MNRLASTLGTGEAVAIAARLLWQEQIGKELNAPLSQHEVDWFGAGRVEPVRGNAGSALLAEIRRVLEYSWTSPDREGFGPSLETEPHRARFSISSRALAGE